MKLDKIKYIVLALFFILVLDFHGSINLEIASPQSDSIYQVYFDRGDGYHEEDSRVVKIAKNNELSLVVFDLPSEEIKALRIDPGILEGQIVIKSIYFKSALGKRRLVSLSEITPIHQILDVKKQDSVFILTSTGADPHFLVNKNYSDLHKWLSGDLSKLKLFLFIIIAIFTAGIIFTQNNTYVLSIRNTLKNQLLKIESSIKACPKKINYFFFILFLTPVILGLLYVILYGINVPYWDDWAIVPLFEKFHSGDLTLSDFFAQHNEHRLFFPRIVILLLGILTQFNSVAGMYTTQLLCFIALLIVFIKLKKQFGFNITTIPIWIFPISILIFSWRQYTNFLWGLQLVYLMPLVCSLLSFFLIDRLNQNDRKNGARKHFFNFTFAIVFAVIASFSMIMGLLVWLAGIFQLFFLSNKNLKKHIYLGIWTISGIAAWGIYYFNYSKLEHHHSISFIFSHPLNFMKSFTTFIGSALFWNEHMSYIAGIIILLLIVFAFFRIFKLKIIRENSFWLTIMVFSFMVCGAISIGRTFRQGDLLQPRFTTYSLPIILALYILLLQSTYSKKKSGNLSVAFFTILILIVAGNITSYTKGLKFGKEIKDKRKNLAVTLRTYETQPDEALRELYPSAEHVRKLAKELQKLNYSVFKDNDKNSSR